MNTNDLDQLLLDVNRKYLMEHTANISKEIRLSGSDEELRAFHYVKSQLESYGLKAQLLFQDAYISIPIRAQLKIGEQLVNCITHSMAPSTGPEGMNGELVYVGEIRNGVDIKGKIAILDGIALPKSVATVEELGAVAVIFINGPLTHEMIVSTVWGNPTPGAVYPKIPVISVNEEAGVHIKNNIGRMCWIQTEVDTGWRKIPALVSEIKGVSEQDTFLLFSGHIDSWHYGAMDNASANATMLEVARILSNQELRRSVRFAFWSGHSHGRYAGSASYCDTHFEEIHDHCFLHVYVDSVGGKGANILSESNCMAETKELAASVIEPLTGDPFIGKRFARAGDQSFWGAGVASLYMGMSEQPLSNDPASQALFKLFGGEKAGGFGWWWHTTEDTLDKIDEQNLVRDCEVYVATIYKACTDKIIPIDQRAVVQELIDVISDYQLIAGARLKFDVTVRRLNHLHEQLTSLYNKSTTLNDVEAERFNHAIIKLSRILVPLNYVQGDTYEHDLTVSQVPVPALSLVSDLGAVKEGSHEYYQLRTLLQRRLNKINHKLKNANFIVEKLLNTVPN